VGLPPKPVGFGYLPRCVNHASNWTNYYHYGIINYSNKKAFKVL